MEAHLGVTPPAVPAAVPAVAYGAVPLTEAATLLSSLARLSPTGSVKSAVPLPMEQYSHG